MRRHARRAVQALWRPGPQAMPLPVGGGGGGGGAWRVARHPAFPAPASAALAAPISSLAAAHRRWTTAATALPGGPPVRHAPATHLPTRRHARVSAPVSAAVEVRVAAMGESITEGSVAAVLAPPGIVVAEDDVIAQIETDKVTIDVRAPSAGVVQQVLVKPEESVVVGQLVAILGEEALEGTPTPQAATAPAATPAPAAAAVAPSTSHKAAAAAAPAARVPSIRFPPRRTPGGDVISTLPAAAQAAALAAVTGGSSASGRTTAPAPPSSPTPTPTPTPTTSSVPPLSQRISGLYASSSDTKWYAGKERGVKLSASRLLSDKEMELIELGGAV